MPDLQFIRPILILSLAFAFQVLASYTEPSKMKYTVKRIDQPLQINAEWDKAPWNGIASIELKNYMGNRPDHFPKTLAKMAYDDLAVYLVFRVEDRFVKAVCAENQGPVYKDSCVEFFFTPEEDVENGYFNLEMNCGGTLLFHHKGKMEGRGTHVSTEHIDQIQVAHSLPKIIDPEIVEQTNWVVEYRIPLSMLANYHHIQKPKPGTIWRANFYKCADATTHPHWLTWAPVEFPRPNFHLPEFFGILEFQ